MNNDRYFGRRPKSDSEIDTKFEQIEIMIEEETSFIGFTCMGLSQQNQLFIDDVEIYFGDKEIQNTQSDVSDSLWAIVRPELTFHPIDMGTVYRNSRRDSLVRGYLRNRGNGRCHVSRIYISDDPEENFEVIAGGGEFTMEPDGYHSVEFRFSPESVGQKSAIVNFEIARDSANPIRGDIYGVCIDSSVSLAAGFIDFGKIHIGNRRDSLIFLIENTGSDNVNINSTDLLGPDKDQFDIINGGGSFLLVPGEQRELRLRFAPVRIGRTSGMLGFDVAGLDDPVMAQLYGEGIMEGSYSAVLQAGSAKAAAGEFLEIPIYLLNADSEIYSFANSINTELQFNSSILYPADFPDAPVDNGIRTIRLDGLPLPPDENGEIGRIRFKAALGNARSTELRLVDYEVVGGNVDLDTLNGVFTLTGLCEEGGTRLINPNAGETAIKQVTPNPSSSDVGIIIESIEDGYTTLELIDINGVMIKNIYAGNLTNGTYNFNIDINDLNSGVYYLVLKTPGLVKTRKLEIVR
jgi:hypothetical protein